MSSTDQQTNTENHQEQEQQTNNTDTDNNICPVNTIQSFEMQQYQATTSYDPFGARAGLIFPDLGPPPVPQPQLLPWTLAPSIHSFNDPFLSPYGGLFTRRPSSSSSLQFAYDGLLSDAMASAPFGLQAELNKMTAQEIMDAKALAASKSHSEAERRRRERINNHLAKLRSLLPSTTKTDKASLLAEVIQHVKELRRQTSIISETSTVPTETDELTVDATSEGEDGKLIIKASLCCDDRTDLLPDLIKALKSLRLRTLKAEITTLGGRVKNVLFITQEPRSDDQEHDDDQQPQCSISTIQEALKAVVEKSGGGDDSGTAKRQRTSNIIIGS